MLDNSAPSSGLVQNFIRKFSWRHTSCMYELKKNELIENIMNRYKRGRQALASREFVVLKNNLEFLGLVDSIAGNHVDIAAQKLRDLEEEAIESFQSLCKTSQDDLEAGNSREFETLFEDFRGFVLNITCLMKDTNSVKSFRLTNQLVHERLCMHVSSVETAFDGFDFSVMKQKVEDVRRFGGFIADGYSLFHEELKGCTHVEDDKWLDCIKSKISDHFQNGRDLKRIKYYAILGVLPSASKEEVGRSFRKKV